MRNRRVAAGASTGASDRGRPLGGGGPDATPLMVTMAAAGLEVADAPAYDVQTGRKNGGRRDGELTELTG